MYGDVPPLTLKSIVPFDIKQDVRSVVVIVEILAIAVIGAIVVATAAVTVRTVAAKAAVVLYLHQLSF